MSNMINFPCTLVLKIDFMQLLPKILHEGGFGLNVIMFLNNWSHPVKSLVVLEGSDLPVAGSDQLQIE